MLTNTNKLKIYEFGPANCPYSGGILLVAANNLREARKIAITHSQTISQSYMTKGVQFDRRTFTTGKPRILVDAVYIE